MTTPNASEPFVVDSSGWVEYFGEGQKAGAFAPYLEREHLVLVPTIVIYEVYRKLCKDRGRSAADRFLSQALRGKTVDLDGHLAQAAAKASLEHGLAMADAIIYATARTCEAQLITSDTHFRRLPGVTLL